MSRTIAVDGCTAENGLEEVVEGLELVSNSYIDGERISDNLDIILVCDTRNNQELLEKLPLNVHVFPASDLIAMHENPSKVLRRKDCSVRLCANLVNSGDAYAFISPGNTGATVIASTKYLGRIGEEEDYGIRDWAPLVSVFPTVKRGEYSVVLDFGANVDCTPEQLMDFAIIGKEFYRYLFDETDPVIGILSNGKEPTKGDRLCKKARNLLVESDMFNHYHCEMDDGRGGKILCKGYCEPEDIVNREAHVFVCDGFVGNASLKMGEAVSKAIRAAIKEETLKDPFSIVAGFISYPIMREVKSRLSSEAYGGALQLGLNHPVMVCHGAVNAEGLASAIISLYNYSDVCDVINPRIEEELRRYKSK